MYPIDYFPTLVKKPIMSLKSGDASRYVPKTHSFLNQALRLCKTNYENASPCNLQRYIFGRCLIKKGVRPFSILTFKNTLSKPLNFLKLSQLTLYQYHSMNFKTYSININSIKELTKHWTKLTMCKFFIFLNSFYFIYTFVDIED